MHDVTEENSVPMAPAPFTAARRPIDQSLWRRSIDTVKARVPFNKHRVGEGELLFAQGQRFDTVHLVNFGQFQSIEITQDGREHSAGLFFRGDWLGLDGIANGKHTCSAYAMDESEVWSVWFDRLQERAYAHREVMSLLLEVMSYQLQQIRTSAIALGTLSAEARVADFILRWANAMAEREMRSDDLSINLSRAEIGRHLGLRLESVSRALNKLARAKLIEFHPHQRRSVTLPCKAALESFIRQNTGSRIKLH